MTLLTLSYNVSHEAMTNSSHGSAGELGRQCTPLESSQAGAPGLTVCSKNMADLIEAIPNAMGATEYGFVGLQEASRWGALQKCASNTLGKMQVVHSLSHFSELASFYNPVNYNLLLSTAGEFVEDRPYHILFCEERNGSSGVIFINVHCPHRRTFQQIADSYKHYSGKYAQLITKNRYAAEFDLLSYVFSRSLNGCNMTPSMRKFRIIITGVNRASIPPITAAAKCWC